MKNQIPLYDETADIACSITDTEIPERIAMIESMRGAMTKLERTEHGMLLHFAAEPSIDGLVRRFAVDEKRCCEFWGFAVISDDVTLTLQWDAPPTANELVDRLETFFRGDEPATSLRGLL